MYTAYDAVSYLLDTTGGGAQDAYHRAIRSAVYNAYRDVVTAKDWRWYEAHEELRIDQHYQVHTLPWGVQSVDSLVTHEPVGFDVYARYVMPKDFQRIYDSDWNEVTDLIWTVSPSEFSPDRYDLRFLTGYGWTPSEATLTYRRRPKDLRLTGWEPNSRAGTIDWAGAEARGTGTKFSTYMVGSVLRVSGDTAYHPESLTGIHSYTDEALIYQVPSKTKLYAWSPAGGVDYTGTKYIVSDYLDLAPGTYTALLSCAEMWLARLMGKNVEGPLGMYNRDLRLAFEADAVARLDLRGCSGGHYYDFWHLRPGVDQGVGSAGSGGPNQDGTCQLHPDISGGDADSEVQGEWQGSVSGGNSASNFDSCGDPR